MLLTSHSKHLDPLLGDVIALKIFIVGSPCYRNVEEVLRNPSLPEQANSLGGEV